MSDDLLFGVRKAEGWDRFRVIIMTRFQGVGPDGKLKPDTFKTYAQAASRRNQLNREPTQLVLGGTQC